MQKSVTIGQQVVLWHANYFKWQYLSQCLAIFIIMM